MAVQSDLQRIEGAGVWMRENKDKISVSKPDLRGAYNALDDFFTANVASINNAFPPEAKSGLTTTQKAHLLVRVISDRYLNGA